MDQGTLVSEQIHAAEELIRAFDAHWPVKAAFWLKKAGDDELRYLYLTSDSITDADVKDAYDDVVQLAGPLRSVYLSAFRVKLIPGDDPLAVAVADLIHRYPSQLPIRTGGRLADVTVDDVYIYPPLAPAAAS